MHMRFFLNFISLRVGINACLLPLDLSCFRAVFTVCIFNNEPNLQLLSTSEKYAISNSCFFMRCNLNIFTAPLLLKEDLGYSLIK